MKIINDIITFDDNDLALFSPGIQKALQDYAGNSLDDQGNLKVPAARFITDRMNEIVVAARNVAKRVQLDNLSELAEALVTTDAKGKADAQVFLDQAATAVGIVIKPQPGPLEPPIQIEPQALTKA